MVLSCKEEEDLKAQPRWILLLLVMGFLHLVRLFFGLLKWVYAYFLRPPKNLKNYGSWAVITGSTDGIGRAFAFQLASKGLNLVLVGRNPNKLKSVSQAIADVFAGVCVKTVVLDFSGDLVEGIGRLMEVIGGLDVGVLVNNAGDGSPYAMYFDEMEEEAWKNMIKVNVEGLTRVTQAVLPGMLEKKKGAIVNIGSGSTIVIPCHPLYTVYAATKSYIEQFSRSLHVEYKNSGIYVQCQVPLFVATKMAGIKRPSFFVPTPNDYAISALRWIGYEPLCTPYWTHSLQWFFASLTPHFVIDAWRLRWGIRQRKWCIIHGKIKVTPRDVKLS